MDGNDVTFSISASEGHAPRGLALQMEQKMNRIWSHVASTVPGFITTSILYLEPVSSLMVLVWPNLVPSTL